MSTTRTLRALLLLVIVILGAIELGDRILDPGPHRSRHEGEG